MPGIDSRAPDARTRAAGRRCRPASCRLLLEPLERVGHLVRHALGLLLVGLHVRDAGLGRDGEAGGDALGAQHARHLGDVRALSAEEVAHVLGALGEVIDPLLVRHAAGLYATDCHLTCAWCSTVALIARSAWPGARGSASGVSESGRPIAATRKSVGRLVSRNAPASQALQTTPPAAPEKPWRCSRSPQEAQAESWGAKPAASSSFRRNASALARSARSGAASSSASSLASR